MALPKTFPDGAKYVVEVRGATVRRYVVFPNGRKINLSNRKAIRYACRDANVSVVPDHAEQPYAPLLQRRIFA